MKTLLTLGMGLLVAACGSDSTNVARPRPASVAELVGTKWFSGCVAYGLANSKREILAFGARGFTLEIDEFSDTGCGTLWSRERVEGTVADVPGETGNELAVDFTTVSVSLTEFNPALPPGRLGVSRNLPARGGEISRNTIRREAERVYLNRDGMRFLRAPFSPRDGVPHRDRPWVQLP